MVLRASIGFLAIYAGLMTLIFFWGARPLERNINLWTAKSLAWTLQLMGADGRAKGDVVESSVSSIRIISECTALYPAVIFVSAVLASPSSWKRKLVATLGIPILAIVNLFRIVGLCYVQSRFPEAAETAHYVVGQSLMIFFTVLLWLVWAVGSVPGHEPAPA